MNEKEKLKQAVTDYLDHGFCPLPVKYQDKIPLVRKWQKLKVTHQNRRQYFDNHRLYNIGLSLGEKSVGLVDVDLDNEIARQIAHHFLPDTKMVFGRKSSPKSHWLYLCDPIPPKTIKFEADGMGTIIELRSSGGQTVVPPSVHISGEEIEFIHNDWAPAKIDQETLEHSVKKIAIASLLIEHWPEQGRRNHACLPLATVLLQSGMMPDETKEFINRIAEYAGDEEFEQRGNMAFATAEKVEQGEAVQGWPTLVEYFDEAVIKTIRKWLNQSDKTSVIGGNVEQTDQQIEQINENHAFILIGGKATIVKEIQNSQTGFETITVDSFKQYFGNRQVQIGKRFIGLGAYWLQHPNRRTYEGIEFAPDNQRDNYYNLWKGFPVETKAGDCSKFLAHIKNNICKGNEKHFEWVVGWMAQIIQQPTKKLGTALVIRGRQGTGKSKFAEIFGSLLGKHYKKAADPRYITGNFNSHMNDCLLLHAEEGFWAGDKTAEGKLKDLITGERHFIELKHKEPIECMNYIRLLVTGNPEWVIPAALEERRFCVFEISDAYQQDHAYFKAMQDEIDHGGREALMYHLQTFDLSHINLQKIPVTDALLDQKLHSFDSKQRWWYDALYEGVTPGCEEWVLFCPTEKVFNHYIKHNGNTGIRHRATMTTIGTFLKRVVPGLEKKMADYWYFNDMGERKEKPMRCYFFPPLEKCREAFEKEIGQGIGWLEIDEGNF